MLLRRILVPFDGSELSKKALAMAEDIARNFNAQLTIFVVIPMCYPVGDFMFSSISAAEQRRLSKILYDQAHKKIEKVTEKCQEEGVKTDYKIVSDDISHAIIKEARRTRASLIIMGSRKLTGLSSIKRLGSTARYVSEHAPCPVTIVH